MRQGDGSRAGGTMSPGALLRRSELAAMYRANAWPLFLQLYQAGDMMAALLWAQGAHDPRGEHLISAVMPEDWARRADVAGALAHRAMRGPVEAGTAIVQQQPAHDPAIEAEAEALYRQHFADSPRFNDQCAQVSRDGMPRARPERCGEGETAAPTLPQ